MDLFKKGTLKSQSLNSRFLASNNNSSTPSRSLPVQPSKPAKPAATPQSFGSGLASKLKLTTSRQSSALRRENSSSQGTNDAGQTSTNHVVIDKKAPVWNKGVVPAKSSKDYTDEELKAMHGISLVSRNSNASGRPKEGRWDDSDEDDDWGDTIDFGDGTKITIGQATQQDADGRPLEATPAAKVAPPRPADFTPAHASPFGSALGSPWKRSEILAPRVVSHPVVAPRATAGSTEREVVVSAPSSADSQQEAVSNMPTQVDPVRVWDTPAASRPRSPPQEVGHDRQPPVETSMRESRPQVSGDARYQYDQNTYDRHWQNPQPSTREIFNSTTGRFEQIDASQKQNRRMSHHDRKTNDLLQKPSISSGDARLGAGQAAQIVTEKRGSESTPQSQAQQNGQGRPEEESAISTSPSAVQKPSTEAIAAKLDPSSPEFLEMQKKLMAERREQAIQRRKDQEAEESARKERARKKAAELAALAEKEKAVAAVLKSPKDDSPKQRIPKILSRPSATAVEHNLATQKATSDALQATAQKNQTAEKTSGQAANGDLWQRGTQLPSTTSRAQVTPPNTSTRFSRRGSFDPAASASQDAPIDFEDRAIRQKEPFSPSQNVWGAIGSKKADPEGSARSDVKSKGSQSNSSAAARSGVIDRANVASWSAFDGIAQSRKAAVVNGQDTREHKVFDAPDDVTSPEKHRSSPTNQSQNRTSSRFFPTAASNDLVKSNKHTVNFVSPVLPPRLDSDDNIHYESPDTLPALVLPQSSVPMRSIDQVLSSAPSKRLHSEDMGSKALRNWFDVQTRSVWEIKPLREGHSPRVKVPQAEKTLDWSRKELPVPEIRGESPLAANKEVAKLATSSTALPMTPAWNMPMVLDTTTRDSSVKEPLIPPQPSLKLPVSTDDSIMERPIKRHNASKFDLDRNSKFYTTRYSLVEEPDNNSPIRIKTLEAEYQVPRKFGRRIDPAQTPQKKPNDVKRQPVNMSDAPGGTGFKKGFANRVRTQPQKATQTSTPGPSGATVNDKDTTVRSPATPSILRNSSPAPANMSMHSHPSQNMPRMQQNSPINLATRPSHSQHFGHRDGSMPQQYMPMQATPPMQAQMNGSLVSRIAPPGLAVPPTSMTHDDGKHLVSGLSGSSIPPPTPRGPPGIV